MRGSAIYFETTVLINNVSRLLGVNCNSLTQWKSLPLQLDSDLLDLTTSLKQGGADGQNGRVDALCFRSILHCRADALTRVEQARGEWEGEKGECRKPVRK